MMDTITISGPPDGRVAGYKEVQVTNFEALVSGVLLFNAIPHLVQGICGKSHMTPFGRSSSPTVNVGWGWVNLLAGGAVVIHSSSVPWTGITYACFCAGGGLTSFLLARFWTSPDARLPWQKK